MHTKIFLRLVTGGDINPCTPPLATRLVHTFLSKTLFTLSKFILQNLFILGKFLKTHYFLDKANPVPDYLVQCKTDLYTKGQYNIFIHIYIDIYIYIYT